MRMTEHNRPTTLKSPDASGCNPSGCIERSRFGKTVTALGVAFMLIAGGCAGGNVPALELPAPTALELEGAPTTPAHAPITVITEPPPTPGPSPIPTESPEEVSMQLVWGEAADADEPDLEGGDETDEVEPSVGLEPEGEDIDVQQGYVIVESPDLRVTSNLDIPGEYGLNGEALAEYIKKYVLEGTTELHITITEDGSPGSLLRSELGGIEGDNVKSVYYDNSALPDDLAQLMVFDREGHCRFHMIVNSRSRYFGEQELVASGFAALAFLYFANEPISGESERVPLPSSRITELGIGSTFGRYQNRHDTRTIFNFPPYIDEKEMWEIIGYVKELVGK